MNTESGLCYIIFFSNGFVKGGKSRNFFKRYKTHKFMSSALGISVKKAFYTDMHYNYHANEKRLLSALSAASEAHVGEFFQGLSEAAAIEALKSLDLEITLVDEFVLMPFRDSLAKIATDEDITGQTLKVMLLLMANLEFENYITIKQVAIAKELKMDKSDVSKAMRLLVEKGIILKVKEGSTTGYKLNPNYGWKGKVSNMEAEKRRIVKERVVDIQKYREAAEKQPE